MVSQADAIRFGVFMPPYHDPRHSAVLALEDDLGHVEVLERLGFDQVWFGEHHSGGFETYPSPELMIAAAAQRTSTIRLGTGVVSLPYHHPLMVADRMAFLDHLTRGRLIFGAGPGALPADSRMMGMDYRSLRPRMEEALEAVLALLDGCGPVTRKTDWFELRDAQLQQLSYRRPRLSVAVASALSPSGPRLAGRHGLGLLSIGGTSEAALELLATTWGIMEEQAQAFGRAVDRQEWSVVGMMHIAPTEREAREETRFGLRLFYEYRHATTPVSLFKKGQDLDHDEIVDRVNETGSGVIGTPEMARAHLTDLLERTGGFGTYLLTATDWADVRATRRSWELVMREVAPRFDGSGDARERSYLWTRDRRSVLLDRFFGGIEQAKADYDRERNVRSEA